MEAALDGAVDRVHATAIAVGGRAVLLRGPSGSGKSDLAFKCLAVVARHLVPGPVRLIADDQVLLKRDGLTLTATAPPALLGKIEVRGVGIIEVDPEMEAQVALIADMAHYQDIERYPDPWPVAELLGISVPVLRICPYEASAPLKLLAALASPNLPRLKASP
jgi:HPr kinase/phosphorylase